MRPSRSTEIPTRLSESRIAMAIHRQSPLRRDVRVSPPAAPVSPGARRARRHRARRRAGRLSSMHSSNRGCAPIRISRCRRAAMISTARCPTGVAPQSRRTWRRCVVTRCADTFTTRHRSPPNSSSSGEYIEWVIESAIFWQATAEAPFRNPAWYLERLDPSMYLTREYAPLPKRLEGFLGYARAVPGLAANIRENLRTPLPKAFIERGVAGFGGYATFFRERNAAPSSSSSRMRN